MRNDGTRDRKPFPTFPTFLTFPTFPTFATFLTFPTFLTFLFACHSSPEKEQEKLRQELKSWDATARLSGELSERGALPGVYLRQLSEAIEEGKQKVRQRAAKSAQ